MDFLGGKKMNPLNLSAEKDFFPLETLPNVHFARWIVVPSKNPQGTKTYGCSLVYAANLDGDTTAHLQQLATQLSSGLDQILDFCEGYPAPADRNESTRMAYLKKYTIKTPGFYVGAPNRSVEQIKNEQKLHLDLQAFIKTNGSQWTTEKEAYQAIRKYVDDNSEYDWAREHYKLPKINWFMMILLVVGLLIFLPVLLLWTLLIHFFYELRAKPFGFTVNQVDENALRSLKEEEDIIYQNQLSQVFETKTGLRRLWLHFSLWFASYLAKYFAVGGQLLGTPTIHFARWVLIDGGKRFVFFSNFDGSFDEYLGDFVDHSGWGLNAIYGASIGYPRTFMIFGGGAYKILEFMGWGRYTQVHSQLWYSAYPWLGLQQIVANSELRTELFNSGTLNDKQIHDLLRKI